MKSFAVRSSLLTGVRPHRGPSRGCWGWISTGVRRSILTPVLGAAMQCGTEAVPLPAGWRAALDRQGYRGRYPRGLRHAHASEHARVRHPRLHHKLANRLPVPLQRLRRSHLRYLLSASILANFQIARTHFRRNAADLI